MESMVQGSLEVGRLADLVILDRNLLKVDRMVIKDIRDIKIVETTREGKTITERYEDAAQQPHAPDRLQRASPASAGR